MEEKKENNASALLTKWSEHGNVTCCDKTGLDVNQKKQKNGEKILGKTEEKWLPANAVTVGWLCKTLWDFFGCDLVLYKSQVIDW